MNREQLVMLATAFIDEAASLQEKRDKEGDLTDLTLRSRIMRDIAAALRRASKELP